VFFGVVVFLSGRRKRGRWKEGERCCHLRVREGEERWWW
jgi:hypothetical protein